MELAKSHCSAVSTDVQLKVIWKERESERESMTKESGDGKKRPLRMTRSVPVIAVICNFLAACNIYKP